METKNKGLAVVDAKSYAIAEFDEGTLREIVETNLGGDKSLTEFDLSRAKIPSGGGLAFNFETASAESSVSELVGVIVAHQTRRSYWASSLDDGGGGSPPDCWSPDGVNGFGEQASKVGGQCARCPLSQFGSAKGKDGKGRGQACAQRKAIFLLPNDSILPVFLSLPPTSLASFKAYLTGLIGKRLPVSGVVTRISLTKEKNRAGTAFAQAVFETVGVLDPENARRFMAFGKMFDAMFRPTLASVSPTVRGERIDTTTGEVFDD